MHRLTFAFVLLLPGVAFAQASGPQTTQPAGNIGNSQTETNQSQQHPAASGGGGASGPQTTQPSEDVNQPQLRTNQSQQPPNAR